jgi:hypothetical protein
MITDEHIKEGLSRAYILAVAHRAGFNCAIREFDYGVDGTFIEVADLPNGGKCESGFKLDFQAKASTRVVRNNGFVSYPLDAESYNRLVTLRGGTPRVLIVLELPDDPDEWLTIDEAQLVLKNCGWWHSLTGEARTTNTASRTIRIPNSQLFNVPALNDLMTKVTRGTL